MTEGHLQASQLRHVTTSIDSNSVDNCAESTENGFRVSVPTTTVLSIPLNDNMGWEA